MTFSDLCRGPAGASNQCAQFGKTAQLEAEGALVLGRQPFGGFGRSLPARVRPVRYTQEVARCRRDESHVDLRQRYQVAGAREESFGARRVAVFGDEQLDAEAR